MISYVCLASVTWRWNENIFKYEPEELSESEESDCELSELSEPELEDSELSELELDGCCWSCSCSCCCFCCISCFDIPFKCSRRSSLQNNCRIIILKNHFSTPEKCIVQASKLKIIKAVLYIVAFNIKYKNQRPMKNYCNICFKRLYNVSTRICLFLNHAKVIIN